MTILTEDIIRQRLRTCSFSLDTITKINITGRDLEDVSLIKKMTAIEVLSLSVNKINTLRDFQFCKTLKELYLRKNNIQNLSEVWYLRDLPMLTTLGLSQNPCSSDPLYRMTVIKNLPKLEKLDDVQVIPEERSTAFKKGRKITGPNDIQRPGNISREDSGCPLTDKLSIEDKACIILNDDHVNNMNFMQQSIDSIKVEQQDKISLLMMEKRIPSPVTSSRYPYDHSPFALPESQLHPDQKKSSEIKDTVRTLSSGGSVRRESNVLSGILVLMRDLDRTSLEILSAKIRNQINEYQARRFY